MKNKNVYYEFSQEIDEVKDAEFELKIEFDPFKINGIQQTLKLEFVCLSNPTLEEMVFNKGFVFSGKDCIEPSSIYLQSVHNPIDLKKIKIERKENFEIFNFELFFDFEYEKSDYKNRLLKIQFKKEK